MANHLFGNPWTTAEIAFLRENYAALGAAAVANKLGRSLNSVMKKAPRVGVATHRRWTQDDDQHLAALWGTMSVAHVARTVKRTPLTTYYRARQLGLKCGVTQGMESFTAAAQRTGFERAQLYRILSWAGVKRNRTASRPTKGAGHRFHMVDPFDVDEAVKRWLATEEIEPAARARGTTGSTLYRWLAEAGIEVRRVLNAGGKRLGNGRVETSVIDRVVAERAAKNTLSKEAQRVGVPVGTLRYWLLRAAVSGTDRKPWLLDPGEVDRVVGERRRTKEAA